MCQSQRGQKMETLTLLSRYEAKATEQAKAAWFCPSSRYDEGVEQARESLQEPGAHWGHMVC